MTRAGSPPPPGVVAVLSSVGATLTIELRGALDIGADDLVQRLVDGAAVSDVDRVRFDLTNVVRCDAGGLRLLARAEADLAASGVGVAISGAPTADARRVDVDDGRVRAANMH